METIACRKRLRRFHSTTRNPGVMRVEPSVRQPETGKFAMKVINHYGDEVLKVFEI